MLKKLKKIFKIAAWSFLAILVLANLYILISGKTYIYTAVAKTYFKGQKGPGIYDADLFDQRIVKSDLKTFSFTNHPLINEGKLTEGQIARLKRNETTSLLIIKNDTVLYENYWEGHTPDTKSNSFSVAKSLVGILIGCAIEDGKINSLDDPIGDYIPEFKKTAHNKITIRHLLSMSSGLDWHESQGNPLSHNAEAYFGTDLTTLILDLEIEKEPGSNFEYKSGNTQVLALILKNVLDTNLAEYASEKIWSKIGTDQDAIWSLDHENGVEKAYCCLYATTRDYAKLGRLMVQNGKWNGIQLLDSSFVVEMTTPANIKELNGAINDKYGLHWWLYPGDRSPVYYARGILGQYIICLPEEKIIIVRTGNKREPLFEVDTDKMIPENMVQLEGHPLDLIMYTKLAFLLDSQLKFQSKR